jgi:hypothetical protein
MQVMIRRRGRKPAPDSLVVAGCHDPHIKAAIPLASELFGRFAAQFAEPGGRMAENSENKLAQAQFAKLQRANDAKQAMADYEAEAVAMRAKTARLRALRLARAADLAAAEAAAPATKKKTAGKPKAAKVPPADAIDAREAGGHDT